MARVTAVLLLLAVLSALGVVSLQYTSRRLVDAIEREQAHTRALDIEWDRLRLEVGTLAAPARVEKVARERLGMVTPGKDSLVLAESAKPGQGSRP
jgi:cell division protein FtsL